MEAMKEVLKAMPEYVWYILGGGVAFVLVAIGVRILLKGMRAKWGNGVGEIEVKTVDPAKRDPADMFQ